jgi:hypothetical protein
MGGQFEQGLGNLKAIAEGSAKNNHVVDGYSPSTT